MKRLKQGFTLIEMMLVLVIIGMIIFMGINYFQQRTMQLRIERTAQQMQQILNAGLAFYVAEGRWPININEMRGKYLPYDKLPNPWFVSTSTPELNQPIFSEYGATDWNQAPANFYVWKGVVTENGQQTLNSASAIAGFLPNAYLTRDSKSGLPLDHTPPLDPAGGSGVTKCSATTKGCIVVASVAIPGQNLNNSRAVNFAGVYRQGGCVPVPQCPQGMKAQIFTAPSSVSGFAGINQQKPDANAEKKVFPMTSITTYAVGGPDPTNRFPPPCNPKGEKTGPNCFDPAKNEGQIAQNYWRVCAKIMTDRGEVFSDISEEESEKNQGAGAFISIMAITRCAITNEPAGSKFDVFSR